jgi:hypothetical protein
MGRTTSSNLQAVRAHSYHFEYCVDIELMESNICAALSSFEKVVDDRIASPSAISFNLGAILSNLNCGLAILTWGTGMSGYWGIGILGNWGNQGVV